jgi:hypothetical protein
MLLLYMYWHHLYNTVSRQSRVLHELEALLVSTGHRKAITHNVQVSMGVEGLENPRVLNSPPASCWQQLPPCTDSAGHLEVEGFGHLKRRPSGRRTISLSLPSPSWC